MFMYMYVHDTVVELNIDFLSIILILLRFLWLGH